MPKNSVLALMNGQNLQESQLKNPLGSTLHPTHGTTDGLIYVALFVLSVLAFLPALRNDFVFDDVAQAKQLAPFDTAACAACSVAEPWWPPEKLKRVWRPWTRFALKLQRTVSPEYDDAPVSWLFHVISLGLHGLATAAGFVLAWELFRSRRAALISAAILAAHPLRSEAVHQIVGQAELWAALLMLLGLIHYAHARAAGYQVVRIVPIQIGFYALALGSKEHAASYPIYVALLEWALANRRDESENLKKDASRERSLLMVGLAATFLLYALGKAAVTGGLLEPRDSIPMFENPLIQLSAAERIPAALGGLGYALLKFALPINLSPDLSWKSLPWELGWSWPLAWLGLIALTSIIAFIFISARRGGRGWMLAIAGLVSFGFVSNLFFLTGVAAAARLWYFPMIAPAFGIGFSADRLLARLPESAARAATLALSAILILLLSATWGFAPAWRTETAFAEATLKQYPDCWRAHYNLSREYHNALNFQRGLEHAARATELLPDSAPSWDYLGLNALMAQKDFDRAESAFKKAMELDPESSIPAGHLARLQEMKQVNPR